MQACIFKITAGVWCFPLNMSFRNIDLETNAVINTKSPQGLAFKC